MPPAATTKSLNILYYGMHGILEYDDLKMFLSGGHRVFSLGIFMDPEDVYPTDFRRPDPRFYDLEFLELFRACGCDAVNKTVTRDFCRLFDVVIINHYPEWVTMQRDALADVPVVMRTVGQSNERVEEAYRNVESQISIVRYSGKEVGLPKFAKTDAVIYFSKDHEDYLPWQGGGKGLTFHNHFLPRDAYGCPKLSDWQHFRAAVDSDLYGAWNDLVENQMGLAASNVVSSLFQTAGFYLYIYTAPPSYTLSLIEAMMAGVPVIAPSAALVEKSVEKAINGIDLLWQAERYEVEDFLHDGAGFTYDSIDEAVSIAKRVLRDGALANATSERGRQRAISTFGVEVIAEQWDDFFRSKSILPR